MNEQSKTPVWNKKVLMACGALFFIVVGTYLFLLINMVADIPTGTPYTITTSSAPLYIHINGKKIEIPLASPGQYFDLEFLTTEYPTTFTLEGVDWEKFDVTILDQPVINGQVEIRIPTISANFDIPLVLTPKGSTVSTSYFFNSEPFDFFQQFEIVSNSPKDGYYYFTYLDGMAGTNNFAFKMDTDGNIVTFFRSSTGLYDFKPTKFDNKIVYSYLQTYSETEKSGLALPVGEKLVVLNEQYQPIDTVFTTIASKNYPSQGLDAHDVKILGDKHYLVASYYRKSSSPPQDIDIAFHEFGSEVTATLLQEIKDGELLWQWDSTDYPELFAYSIELNDFYNITTRWSDYIHWNSIDVDPKDGNYICSFRNLDSIIKIDSETGNILWVLGGEGDEFGLSESEKFRRQHFARVMPDGSITLFDNANNMPVSQYMANQAKGITTIDPTSRILRIYLDEKNKKIINYESHTVGKQYSPAMGSAQLLDERDNRYLVGWGLKRSTEPVFSEVSFDTKQTHFKLYAANSQAMSYRAYKYDY